MQIFNYGNANSAVPIPKGGHSESDSKIQNALWTYCSTLIYFTPQIYPKIPKYRLYLNKYKI